MESLRVGIGMMSRGEVALVVASAGASAGIVGGALFSSTVLMALATTLITPLLLKLTYRQEDEERAPTMATELAVGAFD